MCDRKISGIGGKSGRNECAQVEMESLRKHVVDAGVATTGEPDKAFGKDCAPESTAGLQRCREIIDIFQQVTPVLY